MRNQRLRRVARGDVEGLLDPVRREWCEDGSEGQRQPDQSIGLLLVTVHPRHRDQQHDHRDHRPEEGRPERSLMHL